MIPFHRFDRALCLNDGSSDLVRGRLYHIAACKMTVSGEQSLCLTGHGDNWYNAPRFRRVPDPAAPCWPTMDGEEFSR